MMATMDSPPPSRYSIPGGWRVPAAAWLFFLVSHLTGSARAAGEEAAAPEPVPASPQVRFSLTEAEGRPGETVPLILSIQTNVQLKSISIAINFDESRLRLETVDRTDAPPLPGPVDDASAVTIDNRNDRSGDQNAEGWVHLVLSASESSGSLRLPIGEPVPISTLLFSIRAEAPPGFTPVGFSDIGPVDFVHQQVVLVNAVEVREPAAGAPDALKVAPDDLADGGIVIQIVGEVGFFLRGDATMDLDRDISDPIRTLFYLFLGGDALPCEDAADSDDSGKLELSDPVFTLNRLFSSPQPFPEPNRYGPDPTPDGLECEKG